MSDFLKLRHPNFEIVEGCPLFFTASINKSGATYAAQVFLIPMKQAVKTVIEKGINEGQFPEEKEFVQGVKYEFWECYSNLI